VEGPGEHGAVQIECDDVVFDCGANIGLFSMLAAAKGAKVYAFEPVPAVVAHLSRAQEIFPAMEIVDRALSNSSGKVRISLSNGANTGNSFVLPTGERSIEISTTTIDEFVASRQLERVDFIKADIEGAERLMLAGASDTLNRFGPKLSICTYHLPDDKEVLEEIILQANPRYVIEHKWQKLYAHIPK
jgi:FkbM family methyltransferase